MTVGFCSPTPMVAIWEMGMYIVHFFLTIVSDISLITLSKVPSVSVVKCHVTLDILPPHTEITTSFWKVIQSIWVIKGLSQNMISITLLFLWFAYHVNYLHQSFCLFHISHFSLFTLAVSRENKNIKFEAKVILDFCSFVFSIVIWVTRVTLAMRLALSVSWHWLALVWQGETVACSNNKRNLKKAKKPVE